MNHARVSSSKRLQRVIDLLREGPKTTREIIAQANVCAVNSIIAEINANPGYHIHCSFIGKSADGAMIYEYRLTDFPTESAGSPYPLAPLPAIKGEQQCLNLIG